VTKVDPKSENEQSRNRAARCRYVRYVYLELLHKKYNKGGGLHARDSEVPRTNQKPLHGVRHKLFSFHILMYSLLINVTLPRYLRIPLEFFRVVQIAGLAAKPRSRRALKSAGKAGWPERISFSTKRAWLNDLLDDCEPDFRLCSGRSRKIRHTAVLVTTSSVEVIPIARSFRTVMALPTSFGKVPHVERILRVPCPAKLFVGA